MENNKNLSALSASINTSVLKTNQIMIPLFFIGLYIAINYSLGSIPYIGMWPIDFFIVGIVLRGIGKLFNINFKGTWDFGFTKNQWLSLISITVLSVTVLSIYFLYHPEVSKAFPLPKMPKYLIPFAILLIAIINGLREEFLFRFIFQRCLAWKLHFGCAVFIQALAFGWTHFEFGFPRGYLGVFLATLFGICIGFQYHYYRSFTLTWLTHSLVDFIMFAIILAARDVAG